MFKNVASQKIALLALDRATGGPKTGDAANLTAYVSKDHGSATVLGDTSATEVSSTNAPGWYLFDLTQAETAADSLLFTGKSTTSGIDVVGAAVYTRPPNFPALGIDSTGSVAIQARLKKNVALSNFHFVMTDSTTHNPATGKTVTATRLIDNGSFGAGTLGAVTEVANGVYRLDLPAADLNGNVVTLRLTASGCDDLDISLLMEP
jgi:hypothetical protein